MALVVLTGGVRSGKSRAAEDLASARGGAVVVAVAGRVTDVEMAERIARHRADRPAGWVTLEIAGTAPKEWLADVDPSAVLIVDCLGTLVTDLLWGDGSEDVDADAAEAVVDALVAALIARKGDTVVVTNEVGMGVVPVSAAGRVFRDVLGRANARLVGAADAAYLCVAGRSIDISAAPDRPAWPNR